MTAQRDGKQHRPSGDGTSTTDLVEAVRGGSIPAWSELVGRYERLVWHVVAEFRFDQATREDLAQSVWLKLWQHLDAIREPEALGAWLAITAKRQAIAERRRRDRLVPVEEVFEASLPVEWMDEDGVLAFAEYEAVARAFAALAQCDRRLLRLLVAEPKLSYREIAAVLDRPIGSIGPSRRRALDRLRRRLAVELGPMVPDG
ncbi:MAG TPA: sigma-70 family RNA polymerase sigma factor [Acidimicrobiia bacterium]|jgi:RNA polymerase sigma factor (sigma-70 family)|nr:sigma-70 family RNA polymerase sigma factor [Acidimicrobiia bacterium]